VFRWDSEYNIELVDIILINNLKTHYEIYKIDYYNLNNLNKEGTPFIYHI
jgi:hypothetical protein